MKITGAQKRVTVKDWRSPWKILDEGKGDPPFGRMSRCLEGKSRGWGRVGRGISGRAQHAQRFTGEKEQGDQGHQPQINVTGM